MVASQAIPYALAVLDGVMQQLNALRAELRDWRLTMDRLAEEIVNEQQQRSTFLTMRLDGDSDFNGSVLFEPELVNANYQQFDLAAALRYTMEKLDGNDDVIRLLSNPPSRNAAREQAYRLAIEWMRDESRVRIAEKCVADRLVEAMPDARAAERRELLNTNRKRSSPFVAFDRMELAKHGGTPMISSDQVAVMDDKDGGEPNVVKIKRDLREIGFAAENVRTIVARNQILFLQETTAFPLRMAMDLKAMRARYYGYLDNAGQANAPAVPLHLQREYKPMLMDLMLAESEVYHGHEEDFVIAWLEQRLRVEANAAEHTQEIRYRYDQSGSSQWATLGHTWEEALTYWMGEGRDLEQLRRMLHDENERSLRLLNTHDKRLEFAGRLSRHLDEIKNRCELGEVDPIYKRWDKIRMRIMQKRSLPVPGPEKVVKADPAIVAKFTRMVETAVKAGKGSLPASFAQSLEQQRQNLGLSEAAGKQAIQSVLAGAKPPAGPLDLYRQAVADCLASGPIGDDQRLFLTQMILDSGIDPDEAEAVEREEQARLSGRVTPLSRKEGA